MLSLLWVGCWFDQAVEDSGTTDTGAVGGSFAPDFCAEISAAEPLDPAIAGEGLGLAANEWIAPLLVEWFGTASFGGPASMHAVLVGTVLEVRYELVEGGGGSVETKASEPAATAASFTSVLVCQPKYRAMLDLVVVAGDAGQVNETLSAMWEGTPGTEIVFTGYLPMENVVGTVRPSFETADWDHTDLVFSAWGTPTELRVDLLWQASNEVAIVGGTTAGDVSTSTVAPSGMSESAGYLLLSPLI